MIDWSKIKTVFLDLDGTLLDLHFDNHFWLEYVPQCYAQQHELDLESTRQLLDKKYQAVYGSLDWYSVDYWSEELQLDIAALKHSIKDKISIRPHVPEFLESLHMQGKRVLLVTNAHPISIDVKMQETNLMRYFHRIVTSHELDAAKEQPEFWQRLEQIETVEKKTTLFIDDNFNVLDAARDYGIAHLLAIHRPDSQGEHKQHDDYHLLKSFQDIMPK